MVQPHDPDNHGSDEGDSECTPRKPGIRTTTCVNDIVSIFVGPGFDNGGDDGDDSGRNP